MKICLITNLYKPFIIGGAEVYVERIARQLVLYDEVVIITAQPFSGIKSLWPRKHKAGRVTVYSFYPLNMYSAFYAKRKPVFLKPLWHLLDIWNAHGFIAVGNILKNEKPEIVHTHNLNGLSLSVATAIRRAKVPWVHTAHDFSLLCPFANLRCPVHNSFFCTLALSPCCVYRALKKVAIASKPDIVIFPSHACKQVYESYRFFQESARLILPYCVEIPVEPGPPADKNAGFDILYAGQLAEHKGVQNLIRAFKQLQIPGTKLHIAGDGEYKQELQKIAGPDERIIFYGKLDYDRLQDLYRLCDVSVVPSLWSEVLGIVILEALSQGTPVIASSTGGIPEVIKNGYNGVLIKPGDIDGLRKALELLHSNPVFLKELKANARLSSKSFSAVEHAQKLREIYAHAMDNV